MLTNETAKWSPWGRFLFAQMQYVVGDASDASGDDETWSARKEMRYAYTGKTRKKSDWTGVHFWVRVVVLHSLSLSPLHAMTSPLLSLCIQKRREDTECLVWKESPILLRRDDDDKFFFTRAGGERRVPVPLTHLKLCSPRQSHLRIFKNRRSSKDQAGSKHTFSFPLTFNKK